MRRRAFSAVVGGAAAWPLAGHAQQAQQKPRVGVLVPYDEKDPVGHAGVNAFARALTTSGWIDDRNIRVDYRFAANDAALFKKYAKGYIAGKRLFSARSTINLRYGKSR